MNQYDVYVDWGKGKELHYNIFAKDKQDAKRIVENEILQDYGKRIKLTRINSIVMDFPRLTPKSWEYRNTR